MGGPHPQGPRKKTKPQALAPPLPPWLAKDRSAKAETWCKLLSGQTARERGSCKLHTQPTTSWLSSQLQCTPASSQDLPPPCPARREPPRRHQEQCHRGHSRATAICEPSPAEPQLVLREAWISPCRLWQRARAWGKPEPEPGKKAELCSSTQPHLPGQPQRAQSSL